MLVHTKCPSLKVPPVQYGMANALNAKSIAIASVMPAISVFMGWCPSTPAAIVVTDSHSRAVTLVTDQIAGVQSLVCVQGGGDRHAVILPFFRLPGFEQIHCTNPNQYGSGGLHAIYYVALSHSDLSGL